MSNGFVSDCVDTFSPAATATPQRTSLLALQTLGLQTRFARWQGASGAHYMTTRVEAESLADYSDAIILVVSSHDDSILAVFNDGCAVPSHYLNADCHFFVHLLACGKAQLQQVFSDFQPLATSQMLTVCPQSERPFALAA